MRNSGAPACHSRCTASGALVASSASGLGKAGTTGTETKGVQPTEWPVGPWIFTAMSTVLLYHFDAGTLTAAELSLLGGTGTRSEVRCHAAMSPACGPTRSSTSSAPLIGRSSVVTFGTVNWMMMFDPCWNAARSGTSTGRLSAGGNGSPIYPHPVRNKTNCRAANFGCSRLLGDSSRLGAG